MTPFAITRAEYTSRLPRCYSAVIAKFIGLILRKMLTQHSSRWCCANRIEGVYDAGLQDDADRGDPVNQMADSFSTDEG